MLRRKLKSLNYIPQGTNKTRVSIRKETRTSIRKEAEVSNIEKKKIATKPLLIRTKLTNICLSQE